MKVTSNLNPMDMLQEVQPSAMVPQSWSYGTYHQNNPVYINMVRAADQQVGIKKLSVFLGLVQQTFRRQTASPGHRQARKRENCGRRVLSSFEEPEADLQVEQARQRGGDRSIPFRSGGATITHEG
jgi:hypothetical protein